MSLSFIQNSKEFEKYIHVIDTNDIPTRPVLLLVPERVSMDTVCNSSGIKLRDICHSTCLRIETRPVNYQIDQRWSM